MLLEIKNRQSGEILATITFGSHNEMQFIGDYDFGFKDILTENLKRGIYEERELYDDKSRTFILYRSPASSQKDYYPLVVRRFLQREGYTVTERYPELENEIRLLLDQFPDNKERQIVLSELPQMTHLRQTTLLRELESFLN